MKTNKCHLIIVLLCTLASACGGGKTNDNNNGLKDIVIFIPDGFKAPRIGDTFQVSANGIYSQTSSKNLTNTVTWKSSDTAVATISDKGFVTIHNAGSVIISASFSGFSDKTSLVVDLPANIKSVRIKRLENGYTVEENEELFLSTLATLSNDLSLEDNRRFSWKSSNETVATVNESGTVAGIQYGTTEITATALDNTEVSDSITLTVTPAVIGLSYPQEISYLIDTEPGKIIVNQDYSDGSSRPAPTSVSWRYEPEGIITISATGDVDTLKQGTVIATAIFHDFKLEHKVIVEEAARLFVIDDLNGINTLAWHAKEDVDSYTLCWDISPNCWENDTKTTLVFDASSNEYSSLTFSHRTNGKSPHYYALAYTREGNRSPPSQEIEVWPHTASWQSLLDMPPRAFAAGAAIDDKMYVIGGELTDSSTSATDVSDELWEYNLLNHKWTKEASLIEPIKNAAACVVDDIIYLFGGMNSNQEVVDSVYAYDTTKALWQFNITALPVPLSGSTCDVVNNMIYLSGGFNGSEAIATTYRYNPQNNTWEDPLPPLNTARFNHASHVLDDVIYVAGGTTQVAGVPESFFEVTSQVEFFDPASEADGWRLLTAMETPRSDFALHAWGGRLHAVSGVDNNDTLINDIESYDPAENRWLATTIAMPFGLGNSGFVSTLYDNILYSWGGSEQAQIRSENQFSAMQYSTTRGTWTTAQSTLDTRDAFASTLADDTLYVIAGATRSGEASDDVRTYRIQTHSWGKTSPLSVPRIAATAVTHHQETSNVIYVMGGFSGSAVLRDVEAYNPGEGNSAKWVAKSPLRIPRSRAASVIVDSKIYVFGGIGSRSVAGKEILANTTFEIYNTETDLWEVLGDMPNRRSSATTVSINDKIYLIGGLVNGETSNAVDIYTPSTNSWETNASTLISPRKQAASIVFNGRIYLFGGTDKNNLALKSIETYSDFTQTWKEEHSLLLPDVSNTLSAARHQQQIILVGSQETATTLSNNVYVLD